MTIHRHHSGGKLMHLNALFYLRKKIICFNLLEILKVLLHLKVVLCDCIVFGPSDLCSTTKHILKSLFPLILFGCALLIIAFE